MGESHKNFFLDMLYKKYGRARTCVAIVESLAEDGGAFRDDLAPLPPRLLRPVRAKQRHVLTHIRYCWGDFWRAIWVASGRTPG